MTKSKLKKFSLSAIRIIKDLDHGKEIGLILIELDLNILIRFLKI